MRLNSEEVGCHMICMAHLKIIGPKEAEMADDDDKGVKREILERELELIPHRLYANAEGRQLAPMIASHFGAVVRVETLAGGRRRLTTTADPSLDIAIPAKIAGSLPIETGLATIFEALRKGE